MQMIFGRTQYALPPILRRWGKKRNAESGTVRTYLHVQGPRGFADRYLCGVKSRRKSWSSYSTFRRSDQGRGQDISSEPRKHSAKRHGGKHVMQQAFQFHSKTTHSTVYNLTKPRVRLFPLVRAERWKDHGP
jgi:hypothetical protein